MGRLLGGSFGGLVFCGHVMDRVAIFVDAGYLFAQGSVLLAGKKLQRSEIHLEHQAAIKALTDFGQQVSGVGLLRVYWYDGTSTGATSQHLALAHLQDVKLRLGFVNSVGQQKGVDSLIITDMITLARNSAISDAVLVSGDEDLRVGVQQAQEFGVRVHLVGIKPSHSSQSLFLVNEADTTHEWGADEVSAFLNCQPKPTSPALTGPTTTTITGGPTGIVSQLETVANQVAAKLETGEIPALITAIENLGQIPKDIDRQLLGSGRAALGRDLDPGEKKKIRAQFLVACKTLAGAN